MDATDLNSINGRMTGMRRRSARSSRRERRERTHYGRSDQAGLALGLWLASLPDHVNPVEAARALLKEAGPDASGPVAELMEQVASMPLDWRATSQPAERRALMN
ncbi:hypothetical protein [Coralliovum pocilloporae]|uniref:hypothetical protein n=1 Tax=Coralliovum pocilloporae TaxID=3066369 RepID=UPI00330726A9